MDRGKLKKIIVVFFLVMCQLSIVTAAYAEVMERIVAIVNEDLILLSEFRETLQAAKKADSSVSGERVLNEMIENMLLLNEARKFRIGTVDKSRKTDMDNRAVIQEYIDRRIKALIHIPYDDIEQYYQTNKDLYGDKEIIDVRNTIEEQLVKKELRLKLREHIADLRKKAYVRVQLNEEN